MPYAHLLSNCSVVGPCVCPSSLSVWRRGTKSFAVKNPAAVSDFCAEDITASITLHTMCMATLWGSGTESLRMGKD